MPYLDWGERHRGPHAGAPGSQLRGKHGIRIMGGLAGEGPGALVEGAQPRVGSRG